MLHIILLKKLYLIKIPQLINNLLIHISINRLINRINTILNIQPWFIFIIMTHKLIILRQNAPLIKQNIQILRINLRKLLLYNILATSVYPYDNWNWRL